MAGKFRGSFVALVTPFRAGRVDVDALRALVEEQIAAGTDGLVPCGTTGEAPTLGSDEVEVVVRAVVEQAAGRVPVVVGTGTNDTASVIRRTHRARELGADAVLVVVPYYNRPTQEGLFRHFAAVAEATHAPIVLYNVPSRTGANLEPATVRRLLEFDEFVALKEASGNLQKISEIIEICGDRLPVLSGDDALTLPILALGGQGVISVTALVVPAETAALVHAGLKGELAAARALHYRLRALAEVLFVEPNPVPVKAALAMMGRIEEELRLPLVPLGEEGRGRVREVLRSLGLV